MWNYLSWENYLFCLFDDSFTHTSVDLWVFILHPLWAYGYLLYPHCELMGIYWTPMCTYRYLFCPSVDLGVFILSPVWNHGYLFYPQCGLIGIYFASSVDLGVFMLPQGYALTYYAVLLLILSPFGSSTLPLGFRSSYAYSVPYGFFFSFLCEEPPSHSPLQDGTDILCSK